MEIREMRAFVTVVDEGGLSAAARKLHLSQSALSQTVKTLERQLGGPLLIRDHAGARPTELGRALLDDARLMVDQHDRLVAAITAPAAAAGPLRVGVPLELPADLLPAAIAAVIAAHPDTQVDLQHASSTAQLAALKVGELEVGLVRDRPSDPGLDSVLAVEEDMDAPAWHGQVLATLRTHGVSGAGADSREDKRPVPPEVKLAAAGTGRAFALAAPGWARPLPEGLVWHPLIGNPIVRRTWAAWPATSRRREVATLIAALDVQQAAAAVARPGWTRRAAMKVGARVRSGGIRTRTPNGRLAS